MRNYIYIPTKKGEKTLNCNDIIYFKDYHGLAKARFQDSTLELVIIVFRS